MSTQPEPLCTVYGHDGSTCSLPAGHDGAHILVGGAR